MDIVDLFLILDIEIHRISSFSFDYLVLVPVTSVIFFKNEPISYKFYRFRYNTKFQKLTTGS